MLQRLATSPWVLSNIRLIKSRSELSFTLASLWAYTTNSIGDEFLRRHKGDHHLDVDEVVWVECSNVDFSMHLLQLAMITENTAGFRLLLQCGANPNADIKPFGVLGNYLMLYPLAHSHTRFEEDSVYNSDFNLAAEWLQARADANPDNVSMTPLQTAIVGPCSLETVTMLVEAGADVNAAGDPETITWHYWTHRDTKDGPNAFLGIQTHCSTPLRLAEKGVWGEGKEGEARCQEICDFLRKQVGARSETRGVDVVERLIMQGQPGNL
jgi:hypothetical protein